MKHANKYYQRNIVHNIMFFFFEISEFLLTGNHKFRNLQIINKI